MLSDLPAILEIESSSFAHDGERFGERKIRSLLRSKRAVVIVADRAGHVIGWGVGLIWKPRGAIVGRVYGLAVIPPARGLKLGGGMLGHLIDDLKKRGAVRIYLEVRADNASAIRLYEKFGFRQCEALANFYGPGLHAHRMLRESQ